MTADSNFSVLSIFKLGLGPSSSHTMGPMTAAKQFTEALTQRGLLNQVARLRVELFGSLALTGKGHRTDTAILLGLSGFSPETIESDQVEQVIQQAGSQKSIKLAAVWPVPFNRERDIRYVPQPLLEHPNGLVFSAFDEHGVQLERLSYFSVGGGQVKTLADFKAAQDNTETDNRAHRFSSAAELLSQCQKNNLSIAQLVWQNERSLGLSEKQLQRWMQSTYQTMNQCIERGLSQEGELPGGIGLKRRAALMAKKLTTQKNDAWTNLDWLSVYALAVNEENAAGGRVVTAPTNGSAGVIPAVMRLLDKHHQPLPEHWLKTFLFTSAAIGWLYKRNASISAAEMGCQGEIGVASSMAAGAMVAVLGGCEKQIEQAAEMAMEHHLGMTCDPVAGLVQVPCIERNAFGAAKAIQAARMALNEAGEHLVSLDQCIETMRQTGEDMASQYKETSLGGLAVNVVVC